jgi:hypothetical protein
VRSLIVRGVFIDDVRAVLVEVTISGRLVDYLSALFEERSGISSLKSKTKQKQKDEILKIFTGRFDVNINGHFISMTVLFNTQIKIFPCSTSTAVFGLCNGPVMNVFVGLFSGTFDEIWRDFFLDSKAKYLSILPIVYGIRSEKKEDGIVLRLMLRNKSMNKTQLELLHSTFGHVNFSSTTLHMVPSKCLNDRMTVEEPRILLRFIFQNDVLFKGLCHLQFFSKTFDTRDNDLGLVAFGSSLSDASNLKDRFSKEPVVASIFQRLGQKVKQHVTFEPLVSMVPLEPLPSRSNLNLSKLHGYKNVAKSTKIIRKSTHPY